MKLISIRLHLARVWRWYRRRTLYVIADPTDNSITLSRLLFEHMGGFALKEAKVFVFTLANTSGKRNIYAFTVNPSIDEPTQLADIQYNSKYHTIGFETLCPTVARIFYDYGLLHMRTKLTVEPCTTGNLTYYIILPPSHD